MRLLRIALLLTLTLLGCSLKRNPTGFASDEIYYVQIRCVLPDEECLKIKKHLEEGIPKYKYTFTNKSAKTWPYYKAYELDAQVPIDSLMPPHWQLHRLILFAAKDSSNYADHLIHIDLFSTADGVPDYTVSTFNMTPTDSSLVATSGLHNVAPSDTGTLSMEEFILRSVIRYSFK